MEMKMSNEIVVKWFVDDIQAMFPKWNSKKCDRAFEEIQKYAHERIVELGNEAIEQMAWEWDN